VAGDKKVLTLTTQGCLGLRPRRRFQRRRFQSRDVGRRRNRVDDVLVQRRNVFGGGDDQGSDPGLETKGQTLNLVGSDPKAEAHLVSSAYNIRQCKRLVGLKNVIPFSKLAVPQFVLF